MKPPYEITNKALSLSLEIATILGVLEGIQSKSPQPELRKQNRIRTIQGSLSIEGNTLSTSQVTALLDNKRVAGPKKDVLEVVNAIKAYDQIGGYKLGSAMSMLKAHKSLMTGLVSDAGKYRAGNVGIFKGGSVSRVAPAHTRVPILMKNLFDYLKKEKEVHSLIKSCVFHYELMFIHPFSDGNGRIGRLWQSVILMKYHPIFEFLPIESLIKERQQQYYSVLEACDSNGTSTEFIEFILKLILQSLSELKKDVTVEAQTPKFRLNYAKELFGDSVFSRKQYMNLHKTISSATASRDLKHGVDKTILLKIGERALTAYRFL